MANSAQSDSPPAARALKNFSPGARGAFGLDILKDRLYTKAQAGRARRSAQSALHAVTGMLLRLMAPILSFTAEEAWAVTRPPVQGEPPDSVFLHTWNEVLPRQDGEKELLERWGRLREIRAQVARELEALRVEGRIGSSLQPGRAVHAHEADRPQRSHILDDDL